MARESTLIGLNIKPEQATELGIDYVATSQAVVRNQSDLIDAIAGGLEMVVISPVTLTSNRTISSSCAVVRGGKFITNGYILTINGPFSSSDHQCFDTDSGEVVFGAGAVTETRLEWFGALGNGSTDDSEAIQTAVDISAAAYAPVRLQAKKTYRAGGVILPPYSKFISYSEPRSQSVFKANSSAAMFTVDPSAYVETFVAFEGITLHGNSQAAALVVLPDGTQNTKFRNCQFREFIIGVDIDYGVWTYFDRCEWNGIDLTPTVMGVRISGVTNAVYFNQCNWGGFMDYTVFTDTNWGGTTLHFTDVCFDNIGNQNTVHLDHASATPALDVVFTRCRFDGASFGNQIYIGPEIWGAVVRDCSLVDSCIHNIQVEGKYAFIEHCHFADATGAAIDLTASSDSCYVGYQSWGSSPGANTADAGTNNVIEV